MSRVRLLQKRLRALGTLGEAVGALRALSAQHFRAARTRLPHARAYRDEITACLGAIERWPSDSGDGPTGIVVITTDLGLVGDYTRKIVDEALALRRERGPGPLLCIGRRAAPLLERAGCPPDEVRPAPTGVGAIAEVLLPLVDGLLSLRQQGRLASLWLVGATFRGAGSHPPTRVPVLPIAPPPASDAKLSTYCEPAHARLVIVREYLYATLFETLLEASASEHGTRLVVAESAHRWLDEGIDRIRRRISALARETATQEVLEIVAASRSARRASEEGR